jgi:hypothetical protein
LIAGYEMPAFPDGRVLVDIVKSGRTVIVKDFVSVRGGSLLSLTRTVKVVVLIAPNGAVI